MTAASVSEGTTVVVVDVVVGAGAGVVVRGAGAVMGVVFGGGGTPVACAITSPRGAPIEIEGRVTVAITGFSIVVPMAGWRLDGAGLAPAADSEGVVFVAAPTEVVVVAAAVAVAEDGGIRLVVVMALVVLLLAVAAAIGETWVVGAEVVAAAVVVVVVVVVVVELDGAVAGELGAKSEAGATCWPAPKLSVVRLSLGGVWLADGSVGVGCCCCCCAALGGAACCCSPAEAVVMLEGSAARSKLSEARDSMKLVRFSCM